MHSSCLEYVKNTVVIRVFSIVHNVGMSIFAAKGRFRSEMSSVDGTTIVTCLHSIHIYRPPSTTLILQVLFQ